MTTNDQYTNKRSFDKNDDLSKGMSPVRKASNWDRSNVTAVMDCADNVTALPRTDDHTARERNQPEDNDNNEEDSQEQFDSSDSDISDEEIDTAPPDIINTSKKENTQRLAARTTPDKDKKITARTTRSTTKQKEEEIKVNEGTAPKKKEEEAKVDEKKQKNKHQKIQ